MSATKPELGIIVRPLAESELAEAERIVRLAFATFLGLPPDDPLGPPDTVYARTRWTVDPTSVVAAEHAGRLIGSNFATNWGSFGFFGPLTVDPEYWNRGVAQQMLAPTMEIFRRWASSHLGLYTFAHSPKHMALYQKFGFWPRDLVAVMAKQAGDTEKNEASGATRLSETGNEDRSQILAACREVTNANFEGLDLEREIRSVDSQRLGDTILVWGGTKLAAFAVCHTGPGSEAGTGVCYVKFAAVRPGPRAGDEFTRLLDAVESYARAAGATKITAGVNLARREAFQAMIARGFRTETQGVAMETGGATSGYNRAGAYILDDWR
ncbi:MAG TPA: GNAT family N-acetyltransferase [Candidatus Acidoferrales bacterium]|nr:GNAT family N-acetyltransferase [Candidatus Acidoferrales bacterium]